MSTIRSVLVHLDATPASAARLEFARGLTLQPEAALSVMFVAWPPQRPVQLAFCKDDPAALLPPMDRTAVDRAKSLFDNALADGGPPMRWLESSDADTVEAFFRQALQTDLLVLGQHDPSAALPGSVPTGFVESVLFGTDKPALILPFSGSFEMVGRDVLIGWNATPQAARAVVAALPWLRAARRVHVVEEAGEAAKQHAGGLDVAQYLQSHGIGPALHRHHASLKDGGAALLSIATEVGAELLVIGCCGHGRACDCTPGGASRSVLQTMTLPVLMVH